MAGPEFFQTIMGRAFYDGAVPRIAKALDRIATELEKINQHYEEGKEAKPDYETIEQSVFRQLGGGNPKRP